MHGRYPQLTHVVQKATVIISIAHLKGFLRLNTTIIILVILIIILVILIVIVISIVVLGDPHWLLSDTWTARLSKWDRDTIKFHTHLHMVCVVFLCLVDNSYVCFCTDHIH